MAANGLLDVSTLVDWDGHGQFWTAEAARQWIGLREAYHEETGIWLFTSECYRPLGFPSDYNAGRMNTQWYWLSYYTARGKPGMAAAIINGVGTSKHGLAEAGDIISTGYGNGPGPLHDTLERLARLYGFVFDVDGELWHIHYIGKPQIIATDTTKESTIMLDKATADQISDLVKAQVWAAMRDPNFVAQVKEGAVAAIKNGEVKNIVKDEVWGAMRDPNFVAQVEAGAKEALT